MIIENKHKPKVMWRCLKELMPGKKRQCPQGITVNNKHITDKSQIANAFNDYFTSIGIDLASRIPDKTKNKKTVSKPDIKNLPVTTSLF